ncbi:hypothetical protein MHK_001229 [Candidatus Magnetomorum sp. HK-1]|nr:hypothetical protein MHK_001229 [Candidatus Magnetomorum sp. HK-1]
MKKPGYSEGIEQLYHLAVSDRSSQTCPIRSYVQTCPIRSFVIIIFQKNSGCDCVVITEDEKPSRVISKYRTKLYFSIIKDAQFQLGNIAIYRDL